MRVRNYVRVAIIRSYRVAALAVAAWMVWFAARQTERAEIGPAVTLQEAQQVFPQATRLGPRDLRRDAHQVFDRDGQLLGLVLKTAPATDHLIGYSGPSNVLIGLNPEGAVEHVKLLTSSDTPSHVEQVARKLDFWRQLNGWNPTSGESPVVEAVSGSTLTSLAMMESIQQRLGLAAGSLRFPEPVTLDEAVTLFPQALEIQQVDEPRGWHRVLGADRATLGYVIRTSPEADNVVGYRGPSEALLAVGVDRQRIRQVQVRGSFDTPEYVQRVRDDQAFLALLAELDLHRWAEVDFRAAGIEGVSGATQTSFAVAEGIRRTAIQLVQQQADAAATPDWWQPRDVGLLLVVAGALAMAFSPLRRRRWLRRGWQAVLILGFGLWFGDLVSLALMAGWARHGLPWATTPVLVLLVAVALLVPWGTKRQVYCHYLCPHGAAQEWLGGVRRLRVPLPRGVNRWLKHLPAALLCLAFILAVTTVRFDLSQLEPFDAWSLRTLALISFLIAVVGLAASVFVSQAYCRYGCPTGALLKFLRSHGVTERFGSRDWLALAMLCLGLLLVWPYLSVGTESLVDGNRDGPRLYGEAFGTTWSISLRQQSAQAAALREDIQAELEQLESQLSHWRPGSATSQFNASETTLELEYSADFISLVDFGRRLGAATDGMYDITAGPLVNAWGFGPDGPRQRQPTDEEIRELLLHVGWDKIEVQPQWQSLRKTHPEVQIDLGSLLQGLAVDRVAALLNEAGVKEYLIEVGGELRGKGTWTVGIVDPLAPDRTVRSLQLTDAALATSGVYRYATGGADAPIHHVVSPRTGRPVEGSWLSCSVIAPTCLEADGWATALMTTAHQDTLRIAEREKIAAILIDAEGQQVHSAAVASYLPDDSPP